MIRRPPRSTHRRSSAASDVYKRQALISDAGTPLVSDPGKYLVSEAIANDICISPIPGTTSVIAALCVSGFDIEKFSLQEK